MTTTIEPGTRADDNEPSTPASSSGRRRLRPLTIAAVASLSAGAVHTAAIGAHSDSPQAAKTFAVVALFQLVWGGLALVRRGRVVALIGVIGNGALYAGWVLAKWKGISFIDGLDVKEPIQFADGLCAALALISAFASAVVFLRYRPRKGQPVVAVAAVVVIAALSLPGMWEAGRHVHAGVAVVKTEEKIAKATAAAVPPKPYDPSTPLDLSGVKGVTQAQQARAESLVADTLIRLTQWSNPAKAKAAGFRLIAEDSTGYEHLVNWANLNDTRDLDPNHPEALVYRVRNGKRTLVSAIYMLKPGTSPTSLRSIGGPLLHWDSHDDLSANTTGAAGHVTGIADANGKCPTGQVKLPPVPTIHVWIVPHPCGPFALSAKGAGTVRKAGVSQVCPLAYVGGRGSRSLSPVD